MSEQALTIALSKGRILDETLRLLAAAGLPQPEGLQSRKLILQSSCGTIRYVLAKPVDVPTYVEHGVADIGIAGKDVLVEAGRDLYELLDLGIGRCKMAVAGLPERMAGEPMQKVASKYPRIAAEFFRGRGQQAEVICMNGSVELAPLIGLAECIVDVVETGRTLRENGLVVQAEVMEISTRLVANRMSFRLKCKAIDLLVRNLQAVVMKGAAV